MDDSRSAWTGPRTVIAVAGVILLGVALGALSLDGSLTTRRIVAVTAAFASLAAVGSFAHSRLVG
jgi:hypothetical protein